MKYVSTYIIYSIYERIVARIAHCEPVEAEKYYIDVSVSEREIIYMLE